MIVIIKRSCATSGMCPRSPPLQTCQAPSVTYAKFPCVVEEEPGIVVLKQSCPTIGASHQLCGTLYSLTIDDRIPKRTIRMHLVKL